jgi:Transposase.
VYGYNPETNNEKQVALLGTLVKANIKVMLFFFPFDNECIVQLEFLPRGATVNSEHYKDILQCLQKRKRPQKMDLGFLLHHENVPCHI